MKKIVTLKGEESEDWIELDGVRYFCTGDIGEQHAPGQMRVIDRCKNHFKLAQGTGFCSEMLRPSMTCSVDKGYHSTF